MTENAIPKWADAILASRTMPKGPTVDPRTGLPSGRAHIIANESETLHNAQAASRKKPTEDRDRRLADEARERRESKLEESRKAAASKVDVHLDKLDTELPGVQLARAFARSILPDMLAVVAEVAFNRLENGATRTNAADKLIVRAVGAPREYITTLDADLSKMTHEATATYLMQRQQAGTLSMEEADHLLKLSEARESSRVSELEAKLARLEALIGQTTTDPTTGNLHRLN